MIWKLLRGIVSTEDLPLDEPGPGSSVGEITEVLQRANLTDPENTRPIACAFISATQANCGNEDE